MAENYKSQKMRTKYTNEQCRKAKELLDDISQMLSDVLAGEYMSKACRKHDLDYLMVHRLLSLQTLAQCRYSPDKVPNIPKIDPEWAGYEKLYRDVFGVGENELIDFPPDLNETMDSVLLTLTERERNVLTELYGLGSDDFTTSTLTEVGHHYKVTHERIRQIQVKALHKLRHPSRSRILQIGKCAYEEQEREKQEEWERMQKKKRGKEAKIKELASVSDKNFQANYKALRSLLNSDPDKFCSLLDGIRAGAVTLPKVKAIEGCELEDLDLSVRSYNCLRRAGIDTVREAMDYPLENLMKTRNLGRKSCIEVLTKLGRDEDLERLKQMLDA